MKAILKHQNQNERGNALIYVLIAIVLFAALSFTLSRQTDTSETSFMDSSEVEILANRLINYSAQTESVINQMTFGGTIVANLDFTRPGETGFNAGTAAGNINKVYHPQGGGLNAGEFPAKVAGTASGVVDPGWYLGRFNNIEWTATTADDVLLTAFNIREDICAKINQKITGSSAIPTISPPANLHDLLINPAEHGAGSGSDFTVARCAACEGYMSLCVQRGGIYGFYTVIMPN